MNNNIKKLICRAAMAVMLMGWWGFLYPELMFSSDTCKVIEDESEELEAEGEELYQLLLNADKSQIKFKSKLFIKFDEFFTRWK